MLLLADPDVGAIIRWKSFKMKSTAQETYYCSGTQHQFVFVFANYWINRRVVQ
jgi:hypothetical protein